MDHETCPCLSFWPASEVGSCGSTLKSAATPVITQTQPTGFEQLKPMAVFAGSQLPLQQWKHSSKYLTALPLQFYLTCHTRTAPHLPETGDAGLAGEAELPYSAATPEPVGCVCVTTEMATLFKNSGKVVPPHSPAHTASLRNSQ